MPIYSNDESREQLASTSTDADARNVAAATESVEERAPRNVEAAADPKLSALLQKINTISPDKLAARVSPLEPPPEESVDELFVP